MVGCALQSYFQDSYSFNHLITYKSHYVPTRLSVPLSFINNILLAQLPIQESWPFSLASTFINNYSLAIPYNNALYQLIHIIILSQLKMKVTQALVFAVLALQASAFGDTQTTNQDVKQTGGEGGAGGNNTQTGGNGGDAAKSVSQSLQLIPQPLFYTSESRYLWLQIIKDSTPEYLRLFYSLLSLKHSLSPSATDWW